MPKIEEWLVGAPNGETLTIPSWEANQGALRLQQAALLVGSAEANRIARKQGSYALEDSLVRELQLEGLAIDGEFPALSPASWLRSSSIEVQTFATFRERLSEGRKELMAIVVTPAQKQALLKFLKLSRTPLSSPWDLLEVADHFLQVHQLTLCLRIQPY